LNSRDSAKKIITLKNSKRYFFVPGFIVIQLELFWRGLLNKTKGQKETVHTRVTEVKEKSMTQ